MNTTISVYFDFLSPYSYLFFRQLHRLPTPVADQVTWKFHPVILAKLLKHWGQKGPAEIPPKRLFLFEQCQRIAKNLNIPLLQPRQHPFNPLYVLRLACLATHLHDTRQQLNLIQCLWQHIWEHQLAADDPEEIIKSLEHEHLPGEKLLEQSFQESSKKELVQNTATAIELGAFGVPTFFVTNAKYSNKLFWGFDSWEDLMNIIKNGSL